MGTGGKKLKGENPDQQDFGYSYKLSDEVDENGRHFVLASDGSIAFGEITQDTGLTAAPIRLSDGFNVMDEKGNNVGYGLKHIIAGHSEDIFDVGYNSVVEFVEDVAKHYCEIRKGKKRKSNSTYLLLVIRDDERESTLYIELSNDGRYWTVNTGGVLRRGNKKRKDIVWSVPALGNDTSTDVIGVAGSPTDVV